MGANHAERQLLYDESERESASIETVFEDLTTYCTFIGYPYTGSSVVGALLDAHEQIVIAHELNAVAFLGSGFSERQLYYLLLKNSRLAAKLGREWHRYSYEIDGQHQGDFTSLRVIGDKKPGGTTRLLSSDLDLLDQTVPLKKKFIYILRNPFDNISTLSLKSTDQSLERAIRNYFGLCNANRRILGKIDADDVMTLHHEDFISDPRHWLTQLCNFLGVGVDDDYLCACSDIVYKRPRQSRHQVAWTRDAIRYVETGIAGFESLCRYSFRD